MSCSRKGFNCFGAPWAVDRRRFGDVPSTLVDILRMWNVSWGEVEKDMLRDTSRCKGAPLRWTVIAEVGILEETGE